MIRALIREIAVLFLLLAQGIGAQTLEEALQALGKKAAARVPAGTAIHVTGRNLSSMSVAEAARAQATLEKVLRRRTPRQAPVAEVRLSIGENLREYMLVAEIVREGERSVEMVAYRPEAAVKKALPPLEKRLMWEQAEQILDAAIAEERMFVLDTERVAVYERREGHWELAGSKNVDAPPVRDARGRLEIREGNLAAYLPGRGCRGSWKPVFDVSCEDASAEFVLEGMTVRFVAGRNTLESSGRTSFFGDTAAVCGGRTLVVRDTGDGVGAVIVSEGKQVDAAEALDLGGTVTALWPARDGAVAVVRNSNTGRYAAYAVSLDCSR